MTSDIQTDRFPFDGFCPKFDRNLEIVCKDHIPNFSPVALIVFELSCSQTDMIQKLCFSDSGSPQLDQVQESALPQKAKGERFIVKEESAASVGSRPWTPEGRSLTLSIAFML
ncbi:hypothetical protein AVEN_163844-1 [Araneus ventricosus]|uniref:Uncharacterized protein n=1 Tax=Araneus ventricosus TaxID=182803 RepID=A0A4Y2K1D1_ARAVE|nr:hypothetical protein AVEN_163844-1 [Araneus ventricosus]